MSTIDGNDYTITFDIGSGNGPQAAHLRPTQRPADANQAGMAPFVCLWDSHPRQTAYCFRSIRH
jgi:hypothetical protein